MAGQLSFLTLDVFTTMRYTGNPLAIIKVPQSTTLSQSQKQHIAREFNLSETVFLHEQTQKDKDDQSVRLDIFTSHAEIPFAGHPTVGTANYLLRLQDNGALNNVKALQAKAGRIPISLNHSVAGGGVQIAVAHNVHIHSNAFKDSAFAKHNYPVISIVKGMTFILAQIPSVEALAVQTADLLDSASTYTACNEIDDGWREGLVGSYFFVDEGTSSAGVRNLRTRMFATREDPATGSAASALTSYLALQEGKAGRCTFKIVQGVEMGQRSEIFVEVGVRHGKDGVEVEEVLLSGSAVAVMHGTLEIPGIDA
jgi:PhzF family phenazine biosynthesis protein